MLFSNYSFFKVFSMNQSSLNYFSIASIFSLLVLNIFQNSTIFQEYYFSIFIRHITYLCRVLSHQFIRLVDLSFQNLISLFNFAVFLYCRFTLLLHFGHLASHKIYFLLQLLLRCFSCLGHFLNLTQILISHVLYFILEELKSLFLFSFDLQ